MDTSDRISQFMNLISCSISVSLWIYDQERNLIYRSAEGDDADYLQNILEGSMRSFIFWMTLFPMRKQNGFRRF